MGHDLDMVELPVISKEIVIKASIVFCLLLFVLYLLNTYNFLLFHTLVEAFSVIIAFGLFMITWNSREWLTSHYFLFIGISYYFTGLFDLLHCMSFIGMGIFPEDMGNTSIKFWVIGRYIESISILMAALFIRRKLKAGLTISAFTVITSLLIASVLYWGIFPDCFTQGVGLTPFKKISEYIIVFIFLLSIVILIKNRDKFEVSILVLLIASLSISVLSDILFSLYISIYGLASILGHIFKVASYYFIYKAIIQMGLKMPIALLFRDIKRSEERLWNIIEAVPSGIQENDLDGNITLANTSLANILGYDRDEIIGMKTWDLAAPGPEKDSLPAYLKYLIKEQPEPTPYYSKNLKKSGEKIDIRVDWDYGRDVDGKLLSFISIISDITERIKFERKKKWDYLNLVGVIVIALDVDKRISFINDTGCKILGYKREELIGKDWFATFLPKDISDEVSAAFHEVLAGKIKPVEHFENPIVTRSGEERNIKWTNTLLKDEKGNITGTLSAGEDITEIKTAEESMRISEEKFKVLFNSASDAIYIIGENDRFVEVNDSASQHLGYSREEFLKMTPMDIGDEEYKEKAHERINKVKKDGHIIFEGVHIDKKGKRIPVEINSRAIEYEGKPSILSIVRDITVRKEAERQRELLINELALANKELDDFAHTISHDLKAPLRGINSIVDWLYTDYENKFDEAGKDKLNLLTERTKHMTSMIDGVLAYSTLKYKEEMYKEIDLKESVAKIIEMLDIPDNIDVTIEGELPVVVGAETHIQQIWQNLIGNAVNFMDKPKGEIIIRYADEDEHFRFSISDNGPGIDKKDFTKIFMLLKAVDKGEKRKGTGIGLSIVKKIVELNGGTIWVESKPGKGSTFHFTYLKK